MNGEHHQRTLYGSSRSNAAVASFELLHHEAITNVIQSAATIGFGYGGAETSQLPQLLDNLLREFRFLCVILYNRAYLFFYVRTHRFPDKFVFFRKQII